MNCDEIMNLYSHKCYYLFKYLHGYLNLSDSSLKDDALGFPGGAVVENLPANAADTGSSPGLGRSHMPRSN